MRGVTDRPSGLGIGASLDEAVTYCRAKLAGERELGRVSHLSIGVASDDAIPPELPALLADADLACTVHFVELDMVHPLAAQEEAIDQLAAKVDVLEPAWIEEDIGLWCWRGMPLFSHMLNPILDERTLEVVTDNCAYLARRMNRPFLAENPPVYFANDELDLLAFMGALAERAGCGLVLDIGHFIGYCIATGREPAHYLVEWSQASRVCELHLAGYELVADAHAPSWLDDHKRPIDPYAIDLAKVAVRTIGHAPAITLEQDHAPPGVIDSNIQRVARALCP